MEGTGAESHEGFLMRTRAIADMVRETIARIEPIILPHETIARNFGNDRGGSDRDRELIPPNKGLLRNSHIGKLHSIDEKEIWAQAETFDRLSHGPLGRAENVRAINL